MYTEDDLQPVSLIQHLLFCERRAALVQIERIWTDNVFTVEGTHLHEKVDDDLQVESRGDVRISRGLILRSLEMGLIGKADVVEFHRVSKEEKTTSSGRAAGIPLTGVSGLWRPFPVDYKRGRLRNEAGYEAQLCAQAICLEEMLQVEVPRGAIYYGKTRRRKDIIFDEKLRRKTRQASVRLHELVNSGITPAVRYGKKCESCSLIDLCMPKTLVKNRSVNRYLLQGIEEP